MFKLRLSSMLKSNIAKRVLLVSFLAIFLLFILPSPSLAQDRFGLESAAGIGLASGDLRVVIVRIIQVMLGFLGLIAVIMIMYGGFIWTTSGGDPAKIEKAKKILINTIIGIIIILSSYIITAFLLGLLGRGTGTSGPRVPCPGCSGDLGRWGIGAGPISSVFPEPNAEDIPINTWIAVTFKEDIDPTTICNDSDEDGVCTNEDISNNIEICQLDATNLCVTDVDFKVINFSTTTATNLATDKKTFVFTPNKYLGFEDFQHRRFKVLLKNGINRVSDGQSVFESLSSGQYYWSFTTNGELDLDPPEIISTNVILNPPGVESVSGVYPNPDDTKDTYGTVGTLQSKQYTMAVADNSISQKVNSSFTQPVANGTSAVATLEGVYGGSASGTITVTMDGSAENVTTSWPSGSITRAYTSGLFLDIGPYGLVLKLASVPVPGNSWTFDVTASQAGDRIEILENNSVKETYYFGTGDSDIAIGSTVSETLANIIDKIKTASSIFKDCGNNCLETRQVGIEMNSYSIRSLTGNNQNSSKVTATVSQPATSPTDTRTVGGGQRDVAKNTIFEINFNEAINPIFINNIIVKKNGVALTSGSYVVEVSNQYKTIGLRGPNECGVNNCGEQMYCWPIEEIEDAEEYEVTIGASDLMTADDNRCAQWGGTFVNEGVDDRCFKTIDSQLVPFPATALPVTGFIDMSGNSFNGSFDSYLENNKISGIASGPISIYNLNSTKPDYYSTSSPEIINGVGDNFQWSFWVANEIDLQAPLISKLDTTGNGMRGDGLTTKLDQPVEIVFDRIMRSSTLKPGWNYGERGDNKARSLRYLILETLTANQNPVGYWINKVNGDNNNDIWPDYTASYINHSVLDYPVAYGPLAGSGLQSITQNCFLPAGGPINAGDGDCQYNLDDSTNNCVRDNNRNDSYNRVKLPNPASYGHLNCTEVVGANVCDQASNNCKVLYYNSADAETDLAGSWILTKDFPVVITDTGATGCCFGACVSKP